MLEKSELGKPLGMFRSTLEKCDGQHYYSYHCNYKYQAQ